MNLNLDVSDLSESDTCFLMEMIPYVSSHVRSILRKETVISIDVSEEYESEVRERSSQLKDMVVGGKLSGKEIPIKTLYDHTDVAPCNSSPVFDALLDKKAIFEIADGVFAYSGIVLSLLRYFDLKISEFGKNNFPDIIEHEYPVLYPVQKYEKGMYFETFPHYIMFQTIMNNDLNTLTKFSEAGLKDEKILDEMKRPRNVLRHAACAPLYELLENATISKDHPSVYMVKGKCFRNEAQNIEELSRLNEFTMKEFVFIGTPEQCAEGIETSKALWRFFADTFSLNCKVDTANDSFFASNYKKLKLFQILGNSKQEFKWANTCKDSYIAVSSANYHRTHFSKAYNIKNDADTYCNTACFAFGLERMLYAFLTQKGIDPATWDKATFDEISSYVDL